MNLTYTRMGGDLMTSLARALACLTLVIGLMALGAPAAQAQSATTGGLAGTVTAAEDGVDLPGAVVAAVHVPTGTRYDAVTRADGRYGIFNVRVGGPYTVTVTMDGFRTATESDLFVNLGETLEVSFRLTLDTVEEELTVTADVEPLINPNRNGVSTSVVQRVIETLPNIQRSLQDLVRVSPYFSTFGGGNGSDETVVAVAGRNNRYNNIQIDGAVNNDLFGLAGSGTPGGQAATQPISLDAVKEVSLLVSPYDVRLGGFSGGGLNAITRSGSNAFDGSAYWFFRDQSLVGDGPLEQEFGEFSEDEYGFRLGGPIMQDKLFFFVSAERSERTQPSGFSADGSGGVAFNDPAGAAEFRDILVNVYGYDPGGLGQLGEERNSDKLFGRIDWNVAPAHQLTLRHNFIDADNDVYRPSARFYDFPDRNYDFLDETNSTVLQLNSTFGVDMFNEARVSYQTIQDQRSGAKTFPAVTVDLPNGNEVSAGTEPFSTKNSLDQTILELHDDFTFLAGEHTITVGTHNEIFSFDNLFIRQAFGDYDFLSLEDFRNGKANTFDHSFSATSDPNQAAKFDVQQLGLYGGDQWSVNDRLTLIYGLRVDVPFFPDTPSRNPASEQAFGFRTDEVPDGNEVWSPRIGFNFALGEAVPQQIRGGVGIFSGRPPYVWISNQYSNTGIEFTRINAFIPESAFDPNNNFIAFRPDPNGQPKTPGEIGGRAATNEINVIDPNFKFPEVMRFTLGYDADLPWWGLNFTAEGIYAETREDVKFQNLNVVPTGDRLPFDNRPTFTTLDRNFGAAILLTNTDQGEQWSVATKLTYPYRNGFYANATWLYGESTVVTDGTSSQALSNWRFLEVQGDPNNPSPATSDFDPGHQIALTGSYTFDLGPVDNTVSMFYNAQSGQPFATTFSNDINGDFQSNDLLYVPASADEVIITGSDRAGNPFTAADFENYINSDAGLRNARGGIVERNASRAPWRHILDFRYAVKVPFGRFTPEISLDIFNLANFIDSDSGVIEFVPFGEVSPVRYQGIDAATGKPIYQLNFVDPDARFSVDDPRSRWQAKIGLRFSF